MAEAIKLPPGFELDGLPAGFVLDSPKSQAPTAKASIASRVVQGLRDPIDAGAQILSRVAPDALTDALDYIPSRMRNSDSPLLQTVGESFLADPRTGATDRRIADTEKQYQASRGNEGIDWARISGNVLSPANVAIASKVPVVAGFGKRAAVASAAGAGYGALSPVTGGEFVPEKAKQVALGAAVGPAAEVLSAGASRLISPKTTDEIKALMAQGITPTPGQILGGRWQILEDKLTSIPILGDAISFSRGKSLDEFNKAAYKRALDPIGGKAPGSVGREGVADVRAQLGKAYDNLLPQLTFRADPQFAADLKTLANMADALPKEQAARFQKLLSDQVVGKMGPRGTMDGDTFKGIEGELGRLASGLKRDAAFDNRQLGDAIAEVQAALRSSLERSNPQYAEELKAANTAWANYVRIRDAASRQGAEKGKFTPAQLSAAVRAQDKSKGKRAFSEGTALMQDLSDPAKASLASKYPDSGTPGRLLAMLGLGGGGAYLSPTLISLMGLATTPYLPGGRGTVAALLAKRPQGAETVANRVRELGPRMSPALIELLKPAALQRND